MKTYTVSPACLSIVEEFEGYRDHAYLDDARGVPTIGYGTTHINGVPVQLGMTCTRDQAAAWMLADLTAAVNQVAHLVTVPLSQNQVDAVADFVYNEGSGAFASSTLLHAINQHLTISASLWTRWDKAHDPQGHVITLDGLTRRRMAEYQLFMKDDND